MSKKIVIYGAGGHAKVVADCIEKQKKYSIVGFISDAPTNNSTLLDWPILGDKNYLKGKEKEFSLVIAIGDNAIRRNLFSTFKDKG